MGTGNTVHLEKGHFHGQWRGRQGKGKYLTCPLRKSPGLWSHIVYNLRMELVGPSETFEPWSTTYKTRRCRIREAVIQDYCLASVRSVFLNVDVAGNLHSWLRARRQVSLLSSLTTRYNSMSEVVTRKTQPLASLLHLLFPSSSPLFWLLLHFSELIHPSFILPCSRSLTPQNEDKEWNALPNF